MIDLSIAVRKQLPEQQHPSQEDQTTGWVLAYYSNLFKVQTASGQLWQCSVKGLLKKQGIKPLVGDNVKLDAFDVANAMARIASILPRKNQLKRPQVANVDKVLLLAPWQHPTWDPEHVDRSLCHIGLTGMETIIVLSKTDLLQGLEDQAKLDEACFLYRSLGYTVFPVSIYQPETLLPLQNALQGGVFALAGVSGAGKSSLMNTLKPGLSLKVGEVSQKLERGQHTTRHAQLLPLNAKTWVVDTPGFSLLTMEGVSPQTVEQQFPEFAPLRLNCAFANCLHHDEEACTVKAELGLAVNAQRYAHYLKLLAEASKAEKKENDLSNKQDVGSTKTLHSKTGDVEIIRLKSKQREADRKGDKQRLSNYRYASDVEAEDNDDF